MQQELYDWSANQLSGGSSWVLISADSNAIFWGVPVAGTFGLENDIKRSATPVIVSAVSNMKVLDISSGYCHSCIVVAPDNMSDSTTIELFENKMQSLPSLVIEDRNANTSNSGKGKKRGSTNISSQSSNKKGKKK